MRRAALLNELERCPLALHHFGYGPRAPTRLELDVAPLSVGSDSTHTRDSLRTCHEEGGKAGRHAQSNMDSNHSAQAYHPTHM
eukprot:1139693-Pyramimonas_sp.AAC.1